MRVESSLGKGSPFPRPVQPRAAADRLRFVQSSFSERR